MEQNGQGAQGGSGALDEISGRWIRDQLREFAETSPPESGGEDAGRPPEPPDRRAEELAFESAAANLSKAVLDPMINLDRRRAADQARVEAVIESLKSRLEKSQEENRLLNRRLIDVEGQVRRQVDVVAKCERVDARIGRVASDLERFAAALAESMRESRPANGETDGA